MRYKIINQNGLNFLTFTVVEWIDLFTRTFYRNITLESLRFCQQEKELLLHAYVIMPSHIHILASTEATAGLSPIIQSFKAYTARQILNYIKDKSKPESRREWLLNHFAFAARRSRSNSQHQVWQRDNHPIALYSPKVIRQKLEYIHLNPVVAQLVGEPTHYLHSSASNYAHGRGVLDVAILDGIWNDVGYVDTGM